MQVSDQDTEPGSEPAPETADPTELAGTAKRDLVICAVAVVAAFFLSIQFEIGEVWHDWARRHELYELDELIVASAASAFIMFWYARRRWREAVAETRRSAAINRELLAEVERRRVTEDALRTSERRLKDAQRIGQVGSWELSAAGKLTWSDEAFNIFGVDPADFDGTTRLFHKLVHPDDADRVFGDFDNSFETGNRYDIAHRIIRPDGEIRTVRERAEIAHDAGGAPIAAYGTVHDITDSVAAEERLHQAQKMEAVGQLTGGVAHDFNNLLAVIQGNAEMLALKDDSLKALAAPILRASTRGAELTQRLLAFSRRQSLRPVTVDLGDLVQGMSRLLTTTLGETIDLQTSAPVGLWKVNADPGQVENALLNLALNARDAMRGGGLLTIECENIGLTESHAKGYSEVSSGDYVRIAVSDQGSGMSAQVQEHAFEPFFTTKEVGEGSGLGLSMVYGFAKQSGGHVSIYSELGKGTTVKLYLPRMAAAAEPAAEPSPEPLPLGKGETILVIEDSPDVRELAVVMLESLGYRAIDVADAAGARKALADGLQVGLILSDVILPGGTSGPEFAEEARAQYPGIKVIFMSGYPAEAAKRNGFLGSDRVLLNKPFRLDQLARAVQDAMG